jgi:uncharacterized protein (DUF4415 family)
VSNKLYLVEAMSKDQKTLYLTSSAKPVEPQKFWAVTPVEMPEDKPKVQITARFDKDVVDWFKKQGGGYQARMNAVLRAYYETMKDQ